MQHYILSCVVLYLWACVKKCHSADHADTALVLSIKTHDRLYKIKYYEGDPSVWIPTIKNRDYRRMKNLGKNNNFDLYAKLASHYEMKSMLWFNSGGKEIEFGKLLLNVDSYSSPIQDVFNYTSSKAGGVTVDWAANNVYWADSVYNWILMAPMKETTKFCVVLNTDLDNPGDIIVHPAKSLLFWTKVGSQPKIERSDLLGQDRETIVDGYLENPVSVDLDYSTDRLYWVDIGTKKIESCKLDGGNRKVLFEEDFLKSVVGIALYKEYMFAAEHDGNLHIIPLSTPKQHKYMKMGQVAYQIYDVAIFSAATQPPLSSPCEKAGCGTMCVGLEDNTKAECICSVGEQLEPDGKSCSASEFKSLRPCYFYSDNTKLCWYDFISPELPQNSITSICEYTLSGTDYVLGYILKKKYLYIGTGNSIERLLLKEGENIQKFLKNTGQVKAISVDWLNNSIYWATGEGTIEVADSNGLNRKTVLSSLGQINGLVVNPFSKHLYWTSSKPSIEKASLDGTKKSVVVGHGLLKPEHLAMDYFNNRLYWTDSTKGSIESISLDDKADRKTVISAKRAKPFGIAIFQDYLAYTDQNVDLDTPSVRWCYKDGSGLVTSHRHTHSSMLGTMLLYGEYSQPESLGQQAGSSISGVVISLVVLGIVILALVITVVIGVMLYRKYKRDSEAPSPPANAATNSPKHYDSSYNRLATSPQGNKPHDHTDSGDTSRV